MEVFDSLPLAPHTTFRIGGPAQTFVEVTSEAEVKTAFALARERGLQFFPLGAGSNVLISDAGIEGLVAHIALQDISFVAADDHVIAIAGAGVLWDGFVEQVVAKGLFGIENLAGIPGTVGGAVVQNIGAYGVELKETFLYADCIDSLTGATRRITAADALFAYRSSIFKTFRSLVIIRAAFRLTPHGTVVTTYADLLRAAQSGIQLTTPKEVAYAVRDIRAQKFPSATEGGTAGSFFKNPIISTMHAAELQKRFPGLPVFPQASGDVKVSLAWILDHVLSLKGYTKGRVRLYEKQPLVVVATEGATAQEVRVLAEEVREKVFLETKIRIECEVEMIGT